MCVWDCGGEGRGRFFSLINIIIKMFCSSYAVSANALQCLGSCEKSESLRALQTAGVNDPDVGEESGSGFVVIRIRGYG